MCRGGCGMNVKQVSSPWYTHAERRSDLVHLVASHSAGQWSCVMATDPEGRLWDERESHHAHTWIYYTPYALSYKAGSPRRPPKKRHCNAVLSPDNIWPARPWWIILVINTVQVIVICRLYSLETGPIMSQAPKNSHVFILPHQSRCPLSWKLQKEERKRQSDTVWIDVVWRMNKIKKYNVEPCHRAEVCQNSFNSL